MNRATRQIDATPVVALRLTLSGLVQGIGLRPSIARLAHEFFLTGFVVNTDAGVEIHVEGPLTEVQRFDREWQSRIPASADISSFQSKLVEPVGYDSFCFGKNPAFSDQAFDPFPFHSNQGLAARVPADVVVCNQCLAEIQDSQDDRHNYPFTSCTNCGPRYSIINTMPYERLQTGMAGFDLCEHCRTEYESPDDRRFHAQTNACPRCGPQIWLRDAGNNVIAHRMDALQAAASAILQGRIVALRGLGGYQLLADATSQSAVERLRARKKRLGKPLAVMVKSAADARSLARLDEAERQLLCSQAGPIVVAASCDQSPAAESVTSGLNTIGIMLPTTPLHWLLLNAVQRPLVCTSGNRDGEPLVFEAEQATSQLGDIADVWLEHDRPICRPIDDSVVRVIAGKLVGIRLARGYAPLPLKIGSGESGLATGGHQKVAIAVCNGPQAVLGPHLGDLDTVATRQRFVDQTRELSEFYGVRDNRCACDLHPEYFTTQWAENNLGSVETIQHHHAHIVAGMVEHRWLDRQVLGVAFDGTGYGTDGTIWGGEFLLVTTTAFERVGHMRPFPLVGGELAIRQPWRVATALVRDAVGERVAAAFVFKTGNAKSLLPILQKPSLSPTTTSAGRLFDGIATLILGIEACQFEGQAAMLLESACDLSANGEYDLTLSFGSPREIDWRPMVRQVLCDRDTGVSPGTMAMRFHRGLANSVVTFCGRYASLPVVLGGGVFQNRVLVELIAERFAETGQEVGLPGIIPPNDGGLAAGQLAVALARIRRTDSCA